MAYYPKAPGLSWGNSQVVGLGSEATGIYAPNAPGGPATRTRSKLRAALEAAGGMDPLMQLIVANALLVSQVGEAAYGGSRRGRGRRQHGGGAFTAALAELGNTIRAKAGSIVTAIDASAGAAVTRITGATKAQILAAVGGITATSTVLFGSPSFPALSNALLNAIVASPDTLMTLLGNTMQGLSTSAAFIGLGLSGVVAAASVAVMVVISIKFSQGAFTVVTAAGRAAAAGVGALYNADITEKVISCMEALGLITEATPAEKAGTLLKAVLEASGLRPAAAGGPPVAGVEAGLGVAVEVVDAAAADAQPIEAAVVAQIPGTTFTVHGPGAAAWIAARSNPGAAAGGMGGGYHKAGGYRKTKKHSRKSHRRVHRKSQGKSQRKTKSQRRH